MAQDKHLEEGVYAYFDIDSAQSKIDQDSTVDRTKCLGIVEGYLKFKHDDKVCLGSRSCKLIAFFPLVHRYTLGIYARCGRCAGISFAAPPVGGTTKMVSTTFQHRRQVLY